MSGSFPLRLRGRMARTAETQKWRNVITWKRHGITFQSGIDHAVRALQPSAFDLNRSRSCGTFAPCSDALSHADGPATNYIEMMRNKFRELCALGRFAQNCGGMAEFAIVGKKIVGFFDKTRFGHPCT